jgi:outer membrane biosynthesis protein TonB
MTPPPARIESAAHPAKVNGAGAPSTADPLGAGRFGDLFDDLAVIPKGASAPNRASAPNGASALEPPPRAQPFFPLDGPQSPASPAAGASTRAESGLSQLKGLPGFVSRHPALKLIGVGGVVVTLLILVVLTSVARRGGPAKGTRPVAGVATASEPPRSAQAAAASAAPSESPSTEDVEKRAREEAERRFKETVPGAMAHAHKGASPARHHASVSGKLASRAPARSVTPPPMAEVTAEQEAALKRLGGDNGLERKVTTLSARSSGGGATRAQSVASHGEVQAVVKKRENLDAIKACYERALKRDDKLRAGRVDVTVSVGSSGSVQSVSVQAPPGYSLLEPCIRTAVRRWAFPAGPEEYATTFPLILQGKL